MSLDKKLKRLFDQEKAILEKYGDLKFSEVFANGFWWIAMNQLFKSPLPKGTDPRDHRKLLTEIAFKISGKD